MHEVVIIGAGPGGLSAAYYLRRYGHAVSVFEAQTADGGMLRAARDVIHALPAVSDAAAHGIRFDWVVEEAFAEVPAWLSGAVGDADAAARVGRAYLAAHPGEANLDTLLAAIDSALGGEIEAANGDPQPILTALQHAVRAEYLRGESVNVQGWVLSVTETRVYALLALAADT